MRSRINSVGISLQDSSLFKGTALKHVVNAGKKCLANSSYSPDSIQTIINTGIYRDNHIIEPAISTIIQNKLGINVDFNDKKTFSFDILNSGCGMLNGIQAVTNLMNSGYIKVGMVVSSEINTDYDPDPEYTYADSGAAVLLEMSPVNNSGFSSFIFKSFPEFSGLYSGVVSLKKKRGRILINKSKELKDAYLHCSKITIEELLKKENMKLSDIDLLIPSQISHEYISELSENLGISSDKVLNTLDYFKGDTHSTSLFLGYYYALEKELIKSGDIVLFSGAGAGINTGSVIYYV